MSQQRFCGWFFVCSVFNFFQRAEKKAVHHPKGKKTKTTTFLPHCLSQLNALVEPHMWTGEAEEWDPRCKDSALTVWCPGLSEPVSSPWASSGVGLRPSRDAVPAPGSLATLSPVTTVLAQGISVAHRGCAVLHGP